LIGNSTKVKNIFEYQFVFRIFVSEKERKIDIFKRQNSINFGKEFADDVACKRYGRNGFG